MEVFACCVLAVAMAEIAPAQTVNRPPSQSVREVSVADYRSTLNRWTILWLPAKGNGPP